VVVSFADPSIVPVSSENLSMGKLLIQRNEETSLPVHLYSKLPAGITEQCMSPLNLRLLPT
jgi:uracil phosphoribosyltransferase